MERERERERERKNIMNYGTLELKTFVKKKKKESELIVLYVYETTILKV